MSSQQGTGDTANREAAGAASVTVPSGSAMSPVHGVSLQVDLERLLIKLEERRRVLDRKELDEAIFDLKHILDFVLPKTPA